MMTPTQDNLDPALVEDSYPMQTLIGMTMTHWTDGISRFRLPLRPELMNRYGIPHGGLYAVILDTIMGYAGSYTGDPARKQMVMTLTMTTNFLARPAGQVLIGEGRRVGGGKSTFFTEGTVTDELGTVVATGSGTFRYRRGTGI
jgi:uncharacterized protein (TIGR00369 family)